MSGVPFKLQDAATTGNGTVIATPMSFRHHNILISAAAGVNAGAIQIETSNDPADAGTWAQVGGGQIAVIASTDIVYNFEGIFSFIRARVSTTISGGGAPSATVQYTGGKSF